jgi:hypothetical protein
MKKEEISIPLNPRYIPPAAIIISVAPVRRTITVNKRTLKLIPSRKDRLRDTKRYNRDELEIDTNKDASASPSIIGNTVKIT